MRYRVILPKSVQKELDRLPVDVVRRILSRLAKLETDPRPTDVMKLKSRDAWRIRVGDYRVISKYVIGSWKSWSSPLGTAVRSTADQLHQALRAGFTIEEIFNLTKIDQWFLVQINELVDFEEELAGARH